mmetsp:Transcript_14095/g.20627  ORF Transcript_14095/g.20627 Transcript_14095/m.20627 type:complete len:221 (+) Transcript_14095:1268-1930(+)
MGLDLYILIRTSTVTTLTASSITTSITIITTTTTTTTTLHADATTTEAITVEPKDAVRLFGRLAEKYIMLDSSGGMCCYSACSDCEYRLPDGGYIMADQSAARPKWIPSYDERKFESSGKEHVTAWSTDIFTDGPAVTKEDFVERVRNMEYNPTLGGPFLSKSGAGIETDESVAVVGKMFDILAGEKEKLTKHRMGKRIKEIAGGEEGLVWSSFIAALTE